MLRKIKSNARVKTVKKARIGFMGKPHIGPPIGVAGWRKVSGKFASYVQGKVEMLLVLVRISTTRWTQMRGPGSERAGQCAEDKRSLAKGSQPSRRAKLSLESHPDRG